MDNNKELLGSIDNKINENKKIRNIVITSWVFSLSSIVLQKDFVPIMAISLPSALSFGAAISISIANIMLGKKNEELKKQLETTNNNKQIRTINKEVKDNTTIKNFVATSWSLSLSKGLLQNSFPTADFPLFLGFLATATATTAWIKLANKNKELEEKYDDIASSDVKKLIK